MLRTTHDEMLPQGWWGQLWAGIYSHFFWLYMPCLPCRTVVSLPCMTLSCQWDSLLQESLLESHFPTASITIPVSHCLLSHPQMCTDPCRGLIAPREGKIQEQHQLIANFVLLGRFVLAAWSNDEFIESTGAHVKSGCGEWRDDRKQRQTLWHVLLCIIQQVLVRSLSCWSSLLEQYLKGFFRCSEHFLCSDQGVAAQEQNRGAADISVKHQFDELW